MNTKGTLKTLAAAAALGAMFVASQVSAAQASGVLRLQFGPSPVLASQVLAYSWGASQSGSIHGGGGAGKANLQDIHLTRLTDSQSPLMLKALVLGQPLPFVELEAGGAKFRLENVIISSISTGGQTDNKSPLTDNVSFSFGKITYTVGGVSTCFNIMENSAC